jgi:hypothetical protein
MPWGEDVKEPKLCDPLKAVYERDKADFEAAIR